MLFLFLKKKTKKSAKALLFKLVIPVRLVSKVELITWGTPKYYKSEKLTKKKTKEPEGGKLNQTLDKHNLCLGRLFLLQEEKKKT